MLVLLLTFSAFFFSNFFLVFIFKFIDQFSNVAFFRNLFSVRGKSNYRQSDPIIIFNISCISFAVFRFNFVYHLRDFISAIIYFDSFSKLFAYSMDQKREESEKESDC